jgi:hypothetical protein
MLAFVAHYWYVWIIVIICTIGLMLSSIGFTSFRKEIDKRVGGNLAKPNRARQKEAVDKYVLEKRNSLPSVLVKGTTAMFWFGVVMAIIAGVLKCFGY